ncbi:hypothetical protein HQ590_02575, partial [bacterium]|nr:hypothetical protein [bacterium]
MNITLTRHVGPAVLVITAVLLVTISSVSAASPPRHEFTRLLAHWSGYGDTNYVPFVADCKGQIAQVGFYGASFYSLSPTPQATGYPMNLPLVGLAENGAFFEQLNRQLHRRRAKVVGHFNVKFIFGDPAGTNGPTGFFKWYRESWDEKELGPKPVVDPVDLLEKHANGSAIVS